MVEFLKKSKHILCVLSLFLLTSLLLLKLSDIFQVSEAREGSVVKAILEDNAWALPLRSSFAVPSKPPLFHWIGAVLATLFGNYNEFYLRLPSLLASLGTLIVVALYAYRVAGPISAVFAPAILSTMYGFSRLASDGRVDMLFCFFITSATLVGLKGVNEKLASRDKFLIAALAGFATLSKGPTGLVIPILIVLCSRFALKGVSGLREVLGFQWLLAPAIALPWYLIALGHGGESFFNRQIIFENLTRFTGGDGIQEKGSLFYLPHLLGQGAPWSVLFVIYLFFLVRDSYSRTGGFNRTNRFLPVDKKISQAIVNQLIWFCVLLVLLTLSAGKRRAYLMLCLPSIALVLAFRFSTAMEQIGYLSAFPALIRKHRYLLISWGILIGLVGVIPGLVIFGVDAPESLLKLAPSLGAVLSNLSAVSIRGGWTLLLLFLALTGSSLFLWIVGAVKERPKFMGYALVIFLNLTITFYTQCWLSYKSLSHSYKRIGLRLATLIPTDTKLNLIKEPRDESFDVLLYYYGRGVNLFNPAQIPTAPGLYLTRRDWLNQHRATNLRELITDSRPVDKSGAEIELIAVE